MKVDFQTKDVWFVGPLFQIKEDIVITATFSRTFSVREKIMFEKLWKL
jgi:hypothetical protein